MTTEKLVKMANSIVDEILNLLAEYGAMSSKEIAIELKMRGIPLEPRTVRYHLKKLEEKGLIAKTSNGKREITKKGLEEIRQKNVFGRLGEFSEKIEYTAYFCNFDLYKMEGEVPTNIAIVDKDKFEKVLDVLMDMQEFKFLISKLIVIAEENEVLGNIEIPSGKFGVATISNTIYDVIMRSAGVNMIPEFAGLLRCESMKPRGFTELISYAGTTLSPGWLFLRSGLTSVYQCLKKGVGEIITAIRSFSIHAIDIVRDEILLAESRGFKGIIYILYPSSKLFKLPYGNRARLIISAGLNYLAPLYELGFNPEIRVSEVFINLKDFKDINKIH